MKFLLKLFAGMALATTVGCSQKCAWGAYQEELPEEFYSFRVQK